MTEDAEEAQRELLHRIQTEGVRVAYETALAVCRDPKAPAPAKSTASATLFRVAGYFDRKDQSPHKEPHEMSPEELRSEIKRLSQLHKRRPPNIFE
ncbi:hypothetical protein [Rhizobium sp. WYJ-E13]|uniref:hypothetical protein n=1 Tax=Rhizobium sp. WYJ-E13 TaxID=2849093 RepID=UPI001C1EFBA4|nr:hypothetical protein [Rhizobium sp. WYJ-E13]QWW67970.1 hypothetical protein KQ933_20690 [Rhizobium sp. WYJ-E13]